MYFNIIMTVSNIIFWITLHFFMGYVVNKYSGFIDFDRGFYTVDEREIKFYNKIKIKRWKDKLPQFNFYFDKSHLRSKNIKYIDLFISDTKISGISHFLVGCFGFKSLLFIYFVSDPMKYIKLFIIIAIVMFFVQIPFIMIQRYNRFRLIKLRKKLALRIK